MHKRTVLYGVARLLQVMGLALLPPAIIAWYDTPELTFVQRIWAPEFSGFWIAILAALFFGTAIATLLKKRSLTQTVREGFAIVTLGWIVLAVFGAIPFFIWFLENGGDYSVLGMMHALTDSVFEIMSGFTTTGSTILTDIEAVPRGLLFWRSLTHWLGGMGIVTLALVIFPALGVSGYHMFKGEVPGPTTERLQPRLAETATILWGVYALLSLAETVLLMLGGLDWFDALCHTFGTMATGGFSTKNLSVGHFDSDFIHWVIIIFMFLAGVNFLLHYNVLKGNTRILKADREFRFYTGIIIGATVLATLILYFEGLPSAEYSRTHFRSEPVPYEDFVSHVHEESGKIESFYGSFREAAFQVVSITTTTGFGSADFDVWPTTIRLMLIVLMFFGGCAGSTGGGMKMIRVLINMKAAAREIIKMARPRIIRPVKVGGVPVEEVRVGNIVSFFILFLSLSVISSLAMTFFVPDLVTAFTSVVACLANIGPGLAGVGSIENFAWIPIPGKWILIFNMLLGRLEIFTVLVLFRASIWR
ncbi:MAG: TrkH family potassium uptake protein [Bacteroidetes bacterium]|nr:TrkH family potassium uptake protein [Bacteroidota bacterium]